MVERVILLAGLRVLAFCHWAHAQTQQSVQKRICYWRTKQKVLSLARSNRAGVSGRIIGQWHPPGRLRQLDLGKPELWWWRLLQRSLDHEEFADVVCSQNPYQPAVLHHRQ